MPQGLNDPQVIHFATGSVGGAGLAARRLNRALNNSSFNSKFYSPTRKNFSPEIDEFELSRSLFSTVKSAISTRMQESFNSISFFSLFSVNTISHRTIRRLASKENTILQFHNWYNLLSQKTILKLATHGYRVVLTMHDERFFTGGCHYALECQGFITGCNRCPRLSPLIYSLPSRNVRIAGKLIAKAHPNIYFISPSNWLLKEGEKSKILGGAQLIHISNTLGVDLSNIPSSKQRIDTQSLNIGIASMDHNSYVKGGDTLQAVINSVNSERLPINFIYFNKLASHENPEQNFWGKLDYLLSLSRADNSPNVIHEAKLRGIPTISTAVGGITELLTAPPDIKIGAESTTAQIVDVLRELVNSKGEIYLSDSNTAFIEYAGNSVADHVNLYKSILAK